MSEQPNTLQGRVGDPIGATGELTLRVTIDEANMILEGLGNIAFARVFELVGKIQAQARAQVSENGASRLPTED